MSAIIIGAMRTASDLAQTLTLAGGRPSWKDQIVSAARQAGPLLVALLTPASVIGFVLGLWCIGGALGWTQVFPVSAGLFSHWQVWMALTAMVKGAATLLARIGPAAPKTSGEN
jgi:hypothetical protein